MITSFRVFTDFPWRVCLTNPRGCLQGWIFSCVLVRFFALFLSLHSVSVSLWRTVQCKPWGQWPWRDISKHSAALHLRLLEELSVASKCCSFLSLLREEMLWTNRFNVFLLLLYLKDLFETRCTARCSSHSTDAPLINITTHRANS
jgi:hypothetical protein